jgi:hypothetical protein
VDAFLEHRREYLHVGKAAMASLLVQREKTARLFEFDEQNWLRYFFAKMGGSFEEFGRNQVAFITYNYDRSLEHFLIKALQARYNRSEAECVGVLDNIPIIHPHGRLGYLPWQDSKKGRDYVNELDVRAMELCVDNIKVVHEDIKDGRDKDFDRAHQILHKADRIYALGFGFGKQNMGRLGVHRLKANAINGSGFGLTAKECNDIRIRTEGRVSVYQGQGCIEFLRNVVDWD